MSCDRFERLWQRYANGMLRGRGLTRFEAHLAGCPACRARRDRYERSRDLAMSLLQEPDQLSAAERARLLAAADEQVPAVRTGAFQALLGAAAAAALVMAALVLSPATPQRPATPDGGMPAVASGQDRYELRLNTSDPNVKIVWVFDRNLQI